MQTGHDKHPYVLIATKQKATLAAIFYIKLSEAQVELKGTRWTKTAHDMHNKTNRTTNTWQGDRWEQVSERSRSRNRRAGINTEENTRELTTVKL